MVARDIYGEINALMNKPTDDACLTDDCAVTSLTTAATESLKNANSAEVLYEIHHGNH